MLLVSCAMHESAEDDSRFGMVVLDVGQGLAQIAHADSQLIAFDMGSSSADSVWINAYGQLGQPSIQSIVISHCHEDHYGGLRLLQKDLYFSGSIFVSQFADIPKLQSVIGDSNNSARFKAVVQGDTLPGIGDAVFICLWPPDSATMEPPLKKQILADQNRSSLCFRVDHGYASILITGDIDTLVEKELSKEYERELLCDAIVIPHHGSTYSFSAEFLGYVNPEYALFSFGVNNQYGHPNGAMVDFCASQLRAEVIETPQGHIWGMSNGVYWAWEQ